jgi:hypothetical protein
MTRGLRRNLSGLSVSVTCYSRQGIIERKSLRSFVIKITSAAPAAEKQNRIDIPGRQDYPGSSFFSSKILMPVKERA